jgi:hypothetical protein
MIADFGIKLKELLKTYDDPRPFVCDGNPLDSKVFIVGINAATKMKNDFWTFWSDNYGFKKKEWLESYILERSIEKLKPGKTRRNKLSNTRQRIEWLVETIKPIKILETNLFVKPTKTAAELSPHDKESLIFEYLVKTIKPKVIFIHGNEVKNYLEKHYNVNIIKEKVNLIEVLGVKTIIISINHLSRGWSKQKTIDAGELIKKTIANAQL